MSGNCINFRFKKIKINMMDLGGIYLNNDVLEISMYDFVDRDPWPLDDKFIEPIHGTWLHMQDANKTEALSWVLTVKCRNQ